jgi:hypothetical protein
MKFIPVLSRLALLSLVAAAFTLLTSIYGSFVRTPSPLPHWILHRRSAPQISQFPEFLGEGILIAACAVAGRFVLRLRLVPATRTEEQLISLTPRQKTPDR